MSDAGDQRRRLDDLFGKIQTALAGHSEVTVMEALLKSLVVAVGVGAPDLARAEALLDALPTALKPILRAEWLHYRVHRAKAAGTAPGTH